MEKKRKVTIYFQVFSNVDVFFSDLRALNYLDCLFLKVHTLYIVFFFFMKADCPSQYDPSQVTAVLRV